MLEDFDGFIFDLDGTVFLSNELLPGAADVIEELRSREKRIVFLSNKALQRRNAYAEKLSRLGIPVDEGQIVNSSLVTARFLANNEPEASAYVVGEQPLIEELESHGVRISSDPAEINYVVASFDRDFHYDKLKIAYEAIKNGARFIATNSDRTCPVKGGELPDAAGMIGAIEGVTGKDVEMVAGKPSNYMLQSALEILGVGKERCLLVGDRLETDIKMALENGITAALVLTGVTSEDVVENSEINPDFVLDDIGKLKSLLGFKA
ncbi:MAG: HAD-IIA family hydrolase [Candidatus Bipolaricaulota bacterium]|nr:HAD-IIA family hydrolase [Candidatus Bipolaricaulota bacterium]MBS3793234.1 HAD-IIA family hydrolase [Candidatus Bipolaricaulota bacterium]